MTFVQARNFTRTSGRQTDLIVIHDMEAPEQLRTAENVAAWFAGPDAPRASAHRCFDADSNIQCVRDLDVAWHAPGANHRSLGYEHAGYARQSRVEWLDPYGMAMLKISAAQARADAVRYGIPVRFVPAEQLVAGARGFTTHWEVTKAFRRSTHWDPGHHFPWDVYLALVLIAPVPEVPSTPVPVDDGLLRVGDRGPDVAGWQLILMGAGELRAGDDDGIFGPDTDRVVRAFQAEKGIAVDGIVGKTTWRFLWAAPVS